MKGPAPGPNRWDSKHQLPRSKLERNCVHEITPQPRLSVMLSGAKHLWISVESRRLKPEILRFAQDDNSSRLFGALLGLLAQQMTGVSNQFRYRVGFRSVVIAADLTMSIHEHHSCAVHRKSLCIASV